MAVAETAAPTDHSRRHPARPVTLADDRGQVVDAPRRRGVGCRRRGSSASTVRPSSSTRSSTTTSSRSWRTPTAQWVAYAVTAGGTAGRRARSRPAGRRARSSPCRQAASWSTSSSPGNLVPEAFSLEPQGPGEAPWLYVLEYLPAEAPTHYRVRVLDPNTGELSLPLNLRNYGLTVDTQMSGISRDQVVASDEGLLFTLYRGHHFDEGTRLRLHPRAVDVERRVVPRGARGDGVGGAGPASSPSAPTRSCCMPCRRTGSSRSTASRTSSTRTAPRWRPAPCPAFEGGDDRPAAVVTTDHVVVAQGRTIVWLERVDLTVAATATAPATVDALTAMAGRIARRGDGRPARHGRPHRFGDDRPELPADVGRVTKIVPG